MIRLETLPDKPLAITMWAPAPRVYLDQCVLQAIAKRDEMRHDFVDALRVSGGTLLVSWANLIELFGVGPGLKRETLEALLDSIGRAYYFLEVDPAKVIARQSLKQSGEDFPLADIELADLLLNEWDGRGEPTLRYVSQINANRPEVLTRLSQMRVAFKSSVKEALDNARLRYRGSAIDKVRLDMNADSQEQGTTTKSIYMRTLGACIRDNANAENNDTLDILHAVVPVANADLVVLDKKWAKRMNRLKPRARVLSVVDTAKIPQLIRTGGIALGGE